MPKPAALVRLEDELARRPKELTQAKAQGKRILGYFCSYIPEELVWASGLIPVRLCRRGDNQAATIGRSFLTTNSCPFACSCVGLKKQGRDPYFKLVDLVADAPACLQMRRVFEVWERYFGVKVILLSFPRKFYLPEASEYFARMLEPFTRELSDYSRIPVTPERLSRAVELYNHIRRRQQRLYSLLREDPPPITWRDVFRIIHAGFVLDREMYRDILDELLEEILPQPHTNRPPQARLLLAGSIMAPGDEKLFNILGELDAEPVMDELCTGSRGTWGQVDAPNEGSLARHYLTNIPCSSLPYPRLEDDPRHAHISRLIKDYRIQGVIYHTLHFCDAYNFKVQHLHNLLSSYSIPLLHLNSDYSMADAGQIRTRVEAFLEIIQDRSA